MTRDRGNSPAGALIVEYASLFGVEPTLGPLEQDYRRHYLKADASQATFILAATIGALLLTNLVDLGSAGFTRDTVRRLWVIGTGGVVTIIIIPLLRRVQRAAVLDLLVFVWSLAAALVVVYFRSTHAPIVSEATVAVLALGCYTVVPNRLLFRVIPAFLLTAGDASLLFRRPEGGTSAGYAVIFAYGFIHLVGIWSSSTLHRFRRRQFEALAGEQSARSEMQRLVRTDSLTGLISRAHFIERAEQELGRYRRYNTPFATLIVDLDHFKAVNDTYGHSAGDEVLRRFADLLQRHSRGNDLVGRLGGEEFGLLLPETRLVDAREVAARIVADCRELEVAVESHRLRFTVSVGVTEADPLDGGFSDVLRRADAALYAAKQQGRDRVETLPQPPASSY